jgi:hypothetical protein
MQVLCHQSVRSSGSHFAYGSITKQGSKWVRKMDHGQVEAAISHATKKERYINFAILSIIHSLAQRKGKQIAAVAAAARKASPLLLFSLAEEEQEAVLLRSGKFRIVSSSGTVCVFLL